MNAAYMKMESLEFYAELLYKSTMLGGPQEFSVENIKKLYRIRGKFGMTGKHPADVCFDKAASANIDRTMPGYEYDFSD